MLEYKSMKIALVSLSDPVVDDLGMILNLKESLKECDFDVDDFIDDNFNNRLNFINEIYSENKYDYIFDCSGGNLANSFLEYLDYENILRNNVVFVGYSDLTVIINAIYKKTNRPSILFNPRLISKRDNFLDENLFNFSFNFIKGTNLNGVVVGGNLRCFLKLAMTDYFPDLEDKILFLESYGGNKNFIISCLNQLKQIGCFEKIKGVIIGRFIEFENKFGRKLLLEIFESFLVNKPIIETEQIGHQEDSKAIYIGKRYDFDKNGLKFDFKIKLK